MYNCNDVRSICYKFI